MTATPALQPLVEKYRPTMIDGFVGLSKPKKVLKAFCRRPTPGAWLFVGPPGVGKTAMALAVANELRAELHKIPSQKCNVKAIEDTVRSFRFLIFADTPFHVVLADEADQMTHGAQMALLSELDSTSMWHNAIWIFTSNSTGRLESRFRSRCRVLEFSMHGAGGEIAAFLGDVWRAEGGKGCPDLAGVVRESRNNIRDCLQTLEVQLLDS